MRPIQALTMAAILAAILATPAHAETIVLLRHGEKPPGGLGQLSCQGLNRALALPAVIQRQFGRPAAFFAPDPAIAKADAGKSYDYVRPLATIEPAAIAFGLPIHASIGFSDIDALRMALEAPAYHDALVVVAWEHKLIVPLTKHILNDFGTDAGKMPGWDSQDYDSLYVIHIDFSGAKPTASFTHAQQGLNNQPQACPLPLPR